MEEKYKIGVPHIDAEHEKLFEIGEQAYQLLKIHMIWINMIK